MSIKALAREVWGERDGGLSWGRLASTLNALVAIFWVTWLVVHNHALPDLSGVTGFIVGPYAANKISAAVQAFSPNQDSKQSS